MQQPREHPLRMVEHGGRRDRHPTVAVVSLGTEALFGGLRSAPAQARWFAYVARGLAQLTRRHQLVLCLGSTPGTTSTIDAEAAAGARTIGLHLVNAGIDVEVVSMLATGVLAAGSPTSVRVLEQHAVRGLVSSGCVVICHGVPVVETDGRLQAVDMTLDEDMLATTLAQALGATHLVLLSEVDAVRRDHGGHLEEVRTLCVDDAAVLPLPPASAVKVAIGTHFVDSTGGTAWIGALPEAAAVLAGISGTSIVSAATRPS